MVPKFVSSRKPMLEQTGELLVVALKDRMTVKVFSRKKTAISRLTQGQESEPISRNEVSVSCPALQTGSELQFGKNHGSEFPYCN